MDDVTELVIKSKCAELLTRYCLAVNRWDKDAFVAVWADDALWNRPVGPPMRGHADIRAYLDNQSLNRVVRHVNGATLVTVVDEQHARGWSQTVVYAIAGSTELPAQIELPAMIVEYDDEYERRGDEWLITRRDTTWVFLSDADPEATGRLSVPPDQ